MADAVIETLAPIQRAYAEIVADPGELHQQLTAGLDVVRPVAERTVTAARRAIGL